MADNRNSAFQRLVGALNELIDGKELDRRTLANLGGVGLATAARDIRILEKVRGVEVVEREDGSRVLKFDCNRLRTKRVAPRREDVIAACLGTSLARLFEGSTYEQGMHSALDYILERTTSPEMWEHIKRKFIFVHRGGEIALKDNSGELDDIIDGLLRSRYVTIDYQRFSGEEVRLRIQPFSIAIYNHQLYVIAQNDEGSLRLFRFARIKCTELEAECFEYPGRANYDPEQIFQQSFGIFLGAPGPAADVEVLLAPRWKLYASRHRWHPSQQADERDDGVLIRLHVRLCPELEQWILGFGADAQVLKPKELRESVASNVRKMAKIYE